MSDAEEKANIQPDEDKTIPTASFTGAASGPGSRIGRFRNEHGIRLMKGLVIIWMVQHSGFPGDGANAQGVFRNWAMECFGK